METRRLGYFMRIAEDGSLTKASGVLRIAQPALSRQIRLLEEQLGVTLFHRTARGMQLTEEGDYLKHAIAGPLRELEIALQNIGSVGKTLEASLTLGMPSSLTDLLAMPLIQAIEEKFPNLRIRIVDGVTGVLIDWLSRGVIDLAILEETARNDRLSEELIASLPLVLVGPAASKLSRSRRIACRTALGQPLILPSHHLGIRAAVNEAATEARTSLQVSFETDSNRLIGKLVAEENGYALMPECYLEPLHMGRALRTWDISRPGMIIDVFLAARNNSKMSGRQFSKVGETISITSRTVFKACSHHR